MRGLGNIYEMTAFLMVKFWTIKRELNLNRSYTHIFFKMQSYRSRLEDVSPVNAAFMI